MMHTGLNGDLRHQRHAAKAAAGEDERSAEPELRAALAAAHAHYHQAMQDAHRATDPKARQAAFSEARRLVALASRLQARLGGE
jgi:hypothetical protein